MKLFMILSLLLPVTAAAQSYSDSVLEPGETVGAPAIGLGKKFSIHASRAIGPRALAGSLFVAGINEWKNDPGKWGRGWDGYGKRYASSVGRNIVRETIAWGADGALHTDPRYYRSQSTSVVRRGLDAALQALVTRTDSGKRVPAFSNVGSAFAAGQINTLWLPRNDAHFSDGLVYAGVMLLGDAGRNVLKEFLPDIRRKLHR